MGLSIVKVLFVLFVAALSSSKDDYGSQLSQLLDDIENEAVEGVSLIQSGKSFGASKYLADLENDPFGDLADDFDTISAKTFIPAAESGLSLRDSFVMSSEDVKYWFQFCLDLATFAVVASICQRLYSKRQSSKEVKKIKSVATRVVSSQKTSVPKAIDFGPLMKAAKSGDETCWRSLLEETPNIASAEDACGCTALHVAAHAGSVAMAQELIARGADVNAKEAWEETPLHIAARADAVGVCKLLLEHGAEPNTKDASERTPLLSAGHAGKESTCAFLLENGGDCGGVPDNEIPALLSALLLCRMIVPPRDA